MSRADRVMGALIIIAWIALAIVLAVMGAIPQDVTAYLVGADVFWNQGLDPYLPPHFAASAHWTGYPYVYHPGTLALLYPLAVLPAWATVLAMTLLRGAATLAVCRWLVRRYALTVSWPMLALGAPLYNHWMYDTYSGNVATFGLAGWAALDALCGRRRCGWALGAAALAGLLVCVKPVWLLPPLWAAVCAKRADVGAAFVAGAAACLALSLLWEPILWTHWWALTGAIRAQWFVIDAYEMGGHVGVARAAGRVGGGGAVAVARALGARGDDVGERVCARMAAPKRLLVRGDDPSVGGSIAAPAEVGLWAVDGADGGARPDAAARCERGLRRGLPHRLFLSVGGVCGRALDRVCRARGAAERKGGGQLTGLPLYHHAVDTGAFRRARSKRPRSTQAAQRARDRRDARARSGLPPRRAARSDGGAPSGDTPTSRRGGC